MKKLLGLFLLLVSGSNAFAQPVPDTTFHFKIENPSYEYGEGPVILIDEAHNNLHTKSSGLFALANMLEDDGFVVKEGTRDFDAKSLKKIDILVVVNPLHDSNMGNWSLPCPSAFTDKEIDHLVSWVENGGRLFLVADHMPIGRAVQKLAQKFDVEWSNGFAMSHKRNQWPPSQFSRKQGTLLDSPVTKESRNAKKVTLVTTYTGSAFRSASAEPFMVFDASHELLEPEIAWKFSKETKKMSAENWYQGACLEFGNGKLVLMGEAAMFTSRKQGKTKIGMNSPEAPENAQLALNIFRYLGN